MIFRRKINMAKIINPTKVVTGKNTRFSYLIVNEPKAINGGTPKYSVSLIIPKSDTVTVEKIKAAIKHVTNTFYGSCVAVCSVKSTVNGYFVAF